MGPPTKQTTSPIHSFPSNSRMWIISDGKAGNEAQCLGVAEALGMPWEIKTVSSKGVFAFLAPYGPVDPKLRFGEPGSLFSPPWPHLAVACGRLTTPYIRKLRKASRLSTYTVILLDPKTGPGTADLFWVPEHDTRRGSNVITSLTSPHRFSPARLAELRTTIPPGIAALPSPRVAVFIGGPNAVYKYSDADVARLIKLLGDASQSGAGLMISCSRRTPPALAAGVEMATRNVPRLFWSGTEGENPYADYLAHADAFVVTADSVNMTGEACVTGKPVHVFHPEGGSAKFDRFHSSLMAYGATSRFTAAQQVFVDWSYEPLFSASDIAREINMRYARRAQRLGSILEAGREGTSR